MRPFLSHKRSIAQTQSSDGRDVFLFPSEIWEEVFFHLEVDGLLAAAGACKLFNQLSTMVHMVLAGASRPDLDGGVVRIRASASSLEAIRRSIHLLPEMRRLSCKFRESDIFPEGLQSLYHTVRLARNLEWLDIDLEGRPFARPNSPSINEYCNLFHDVMYAMTSKTRGPVVYLDCGRTGALGRLSVCTPWDLCKQQAEPSYQPLPKSLKTRIGTLFGEIPRLPPGWERARIPLPVFKRGEFRNQTPKNLYRWKASHISHITSVQLRRLRSPPSSTKPRTFTLVVNDSQRATTVELGDKYRDINDLPGSCESLWHITEVLPHLTLPALTTVNINMVTVSPTIFSQFLARHPTVREIAFVDGTARYCKSPLLDLSISPPFLERISSTTPQGLIFLMDAVPRSQPCTLGFRLRTYFNQELAAHRALLRKIGSRTADTRLVIRPSWFGNCDSEELEIVQSLRCVSSVTLNVFIQPQISLISWLAQFPSLESIEIKFCWKKQRKEKEFLEALKAAFEKTRTRVSALD